MPILKRGEKERENPQSHLTITIKRRKKERKETFYDWSEMEFHERFVCSEKSTFEKYPKKEENKSKSCNDVKISTKLFFLKADLREIKSLTWTSTFFIFVVDR
jgi:hypothetical protein